MATVNINVKKISENAVLPSYAHPGDAGLDLFSIEKMTLKPNETILVKTGFIIELPEGYEAQIRPRSGLALKHSITVLNTPGTIDAGYRGEIGIILINHGKEIFNISLNMKIAQMVINKVEYANIIEVKDLTDTKRSTGGFGSSGI